jgi:hypothetical protein
MVKAAPKERAAKALDRMEDKAPPKERARFFHDLSPIRSNIHMKAPRKDANDERWLTLLFRMTLNGNLIRSAPASVQAAFTGVQDHDEDYVGIKQAIEHVNVDIHETDATKVALKLHDVTIENLEVKEIKSGKNDYAIVLTFQVDHLADPDLWRFMRTHYGYDVFLVFDSAQASLLDLVDAEPKKKDADDQPPLPMAAATGKEAAAGPDA